MITDDLKRQIENTHRDNIHAIFLQEYNKWSKFTIGDVLVSYKVICPGVPELRTVHGKPVKYQVIYIDELGLPWVRLIKIKSGLGKNLTCLADFTPYSIKFDIDPEQIDSIILNRKYNPREEYWRIKENQQGQRRDR